MIRKMEPGDTERVLELLLQVHAVHAAGRPDLFLPGGRKYDKADLEKILTEEDKAVYVYTDEQDTVQGYAFCERRMTETRNSRPGRRIWYIDDLCVDEKERGKGIGSALFDHVKQAALAEGFDSVELNVWNFNAPALAFYTALGMKPLHTEMELLLH